MKKNKQTQETTDIVIGENIVCNLSFTAYETGALEALLNKLITLKIFIIQKKQKAS